MYSASSISVLNYEIDKKITKKKVEEILAKYQLMSLTLENDEPSLTSKMTSTNHFSNEFHSKSESFIEKKDSIVNFLNWVEMKVEALPSEYKELIRNRYLISDNELLEEWKIANMCNISRTSYFNRKHKALIKLAFGFKCVVYHN